MSKSGLFSGLIGGAGGEGGGGGLSDIPKKIDDLTKSILQFGIIAAELKDSVRSLEETMGNVELTLNELIETIRAGKNT